MAPLLEFHMFHCSGWSTVWNELPRRVLNTIKHCLLSVQTWPVSGALLFFGCGKLWLLYSGRDVKLTWMDGFLTDMVLMGSLLGAVRFVIYRLKHHKRLQYTQRCQLALDVVESVR